MFGKKEKIIILEEIVNIQLRDSREKSEKCFKISIKITKHEISDDTIKYEIIFYNTSE